MSLTWTAVVLAAVRCNARRNVHRTWVLELAAKRDAWLNPPDTTEAELKSRTLTNLYNAMPTWLRLIHRRLDEVVLDAYGWPHELAEVDPEHDEEILRRLLALNLERAAGAG